MKHEKLILNDLPENISAFELATLVSNKASSVGFDWQDNNEVLTKLDEEINELQAAMSISDAAINEELGDVLFTLVNFAKHAGIDPEQALMMACEKFISRFNGMEKAAAAIDLTLNDLSRAQFENLWQLQKLKKS